MEIDAAATNSPVDWVAVAGITAGFMSVFLAIVAIWLSIAFYRMSQISSKSIETATTRVESATSQLQALFDRMYSDVFSMTRDTVSDMRRTLWPNATDGVEENGNDIADSRLAALRGELIEAIKTVSEDVGLTRDKLDMLQGRLAPVVERAISESAIVGSDAQRHAAREDIAALLTFNKERGIPTTAQVIVNDLSDRHPIQMIVDELDRMHRSGEVLWSSQRLRPTTEVILHKGAATVPLPPDQSDS
jgi:uncharacterized protein with von Willebrand factor type A (vWA) domain